MSDIESKEESIEKPLKVKKPRSEKQIEQMKLCLGRRKEEIDKKKYEKKLEASKFLLEHDEKIKNKEVIKKVNKEPLIESSSEEDTSDSEPETIIIKKKKSKKEKNKKKKKLTKVIIESESESDSDSDSDSYKSESEPEPPRRQFKTQQNKKSKIKISDKKSAKYIEPQKSIKKINYFVD